MSGNEKIALSLTLSSRGPYVPGELLKGRVHLYFPKVDTARVEEVSIKLSGSVHTEVKIGETGNTTNIACEDVELVKQTLVLWQKGNTPPSPDSSILAVPFCFRLPTGLPPSYSCKGPGAHCSAKIQYGLHVRGECPGILRFDRIIHKPLIVVPASERGAQLHSIFIKEEWQKGWKTWESRAEIRRNPWGDYSSVHATLTVPDTTFFPTHTPIPFMLTIISHTKLMTRDDGKDDEPLFPAPPSDPRKLAFWLTPQVKVRARKWTSSVALKSKLELGVFCGSNSEVDVHVEKADKMWIPPENLDDEKKGLGQWRQEVIFKSSFIAREPPTFTADTLSLQYSAMLKIPFPGIRNDLVLEFPMKLVSHLPLPTA